MVEVGKTIVEWLASLGLQEYREALSRKGFRALKDCSRISGEDLV